MPKEVKSSENTKLVPPNRKLGHIPGTRFLRAERTKIWTFELYTKQTHAKYVQKIPDKNSSDSNRKLNHILETEPRRIEQTKFGLSRQYWYLGNAICQKPKQKVKRPEQKVGSYLRNEAS